MAHISQGVPSLHDTVTQQWMTAGDYTFTISPWMNYLDIIVLGGGGSAWTTYKSGNTYNYGPGGDAGSWNAVTVAKGHTGWPTGTTLAVTVGAGGTAVASGPGHSGSASSVSGAGLTTVTGAGGIGGGAVGSNGGPVTGDSPGNEIYLGATYVGGATQTSQGSAGNPPGGGGATTLSTMFGGAGANGGVIIVGRASAGATTPYMSAGSFSYSIPATADYLDIIVLGAGGGGGGTDGSGTVGTGGHAGSWSTTTLKRGVSFPSGSTLAISVGTGGTGGGYETGAGGNPGGSSSVSAAGMTTQTGAGGSGGGYTTGGPQPGQSPGNQNYAGVTYPGGALTGNTNAPGNSPGGGGGGGGGYDGYSGSGGTGAPGGVWISARGAGVGGGGPPPPPATGIYCADVGLGIQNNESSWLHSIAGNCFIGVLSGYGSTTLAGQTITMAIGATPVPLLGTVDLGAVSSVYCYALIFGMMSPPTGDSQVVSWASNHAQSGMGGNSLSYLRVGSIGAFGATSVGSGTAFSQTIAAAVDQVIAQFFTDTATTTLIGSYSQTQRWQGSGANAASAIVLGEAAGAASVPFTATGAVSGKWAGLSVILQP